jgi:hypothetical protein
MCVKSGEEHVSQDSAIICKLSAGSTAKFDTLVIHTLFGTEHINHNYRYNCKGFS